MDDRKISWTKQQAHVIDTRSGNLLVAAAAGSGKTAVLVERIIEMVMGVDSKGEKLPEQDRINVDELLVVTFTNAAAAQMKEKIGAALQKKNDEYMSKGIYDEHLIKQMTLINHAEICTIDSFCLHIVKEYFAKVGLDSSFDIIDSTEKKILRKDVMDQVMESCYSDEDLVPGFLKLVRTFAVKERDTEVPELVYHIMDVISSYPDSHEWLRQARTALDISAAGEAYEDKCRRILELPAVRMFAQQAENTVRMAWSMARECQMFSTEEYGLESYGIRIDKDVEMLTQMVRRCDSDEPCVDLFELKKIYTASLKQKTDKNISADGTEQEGKRYYAFDGLSNTKETADPEKKDFIKGRRSVYKKMITDLMSDIVDVDEVIGQVKLMTPVIESLLDLTELYMDELMKAKTDRNLYEFHDIEEFAFRILCDRIEDGRPVPSEAGREVSQRYREILIDEYQDSNFIQEYILGSVTGHGEGINNTFMVGDVKQSIYKFRMARPDLFIGKYDTYQRLGDDDKATADGPGNCIVLTRNFRSEINVLRAVNAIFFQLMRKTVGGIEYDEAARLNSKYAVEAPDGTMTEPDDKEAGPKAEFIMIDGDVVSADMDEEHSCVQIEAEYIADKIDQLVNGPAPMLVNDPAGVDGKRKAEYRDIVILLRSVSGSSAVYDQVFEEKGIPIYIQSESGYFGAVEVSCLISMLSVIDNSYVDVDLAAVLRSPMVGLNEEELARIAGEYSARYEQTEKDYNVRLYDKLIDYMEIHEGENSSAMRKITSFIELLDYLKSNKNYMSISDIIRCVLDRTGFYWFVGARPMGKRRQANIDMLIRKADDFEQNSKGVFNFIRYVNELRTNSLDFAEADIVSDNDNVVRVMTMHKSKGLEFPILFVAGLGKKMNMKEIQKKVLVHQKYYLATSVIDEESRVRKETFLRKVLASDMKIENYAEELRVLYVALTRAKEKLYMTGCVRSIGAFKEKADVYVTGSEVSSAAVLNSQSYMDWIYIALQYVDHSEFMEVHEIESSEFMTAGAETQGESEVRTSEAEVLDDISENNVSCDNTVEKGIVEDLSNAELDEDVLQHIKKGIEFRYGHVSSGLKSKMSITEIKRLQSRGEDTAYYAIGEERTYRERQDVPVPEFMGDEKIVGGNDVGTVYHKIMELLDFQNVAAEDICSDVDRIFGLGIFNEALIERIQKDRIVKMLGSSLGQRMAAADRTGQLYRERQFYMMMTPDDILGNTVRSKQADGEAGNEETSYDPDETVVVQGIIDAYFIEDGQIVLMDYKTDSVRNVEELAGKYHVQLDKYAEVLEQLTGLVVKEKIIYSFCLDTTVNL